MKNGKAVKAKGFYLYQPVRPRTFPKQDYLRETERRKYREYAEVALDHKKDIFQFIKALALSQHMEFTDQYNPARILDYATCVYNEVTSDFQVADRIEKLEKKELDRIVLHWVMDFYHELKWGAGISFPIAINLVSPEWLYLHYTPLHETSLPHAVEKVLLRAGYTGLSSLDWASDEFLCRLVIQERCYYSVQDFIQKNEQTADKIILQWIGQVAKYLQHQELYLLAETSQKISQKMLNEVVALSSQ